MVSILLSQTQRDFKFVSISEPTEGEIFHKNFKT